MSALLIRGLLPVWLMLLPLSGTAAGSAMPFQVDYCVAKTLPADLKGTQSCDWQPHTSLSIDHVLKPAQWVRIRFDAASGTADTPRHMAIQVMPHFIPSITLYHSPDGGQTWATQAAGSDAFAGNPHDAIGGYLFIVTPMPDASTFYLHIVGAIGGHASIVIEPWPTQGMQSQAWLGLHLGILVLILLFAGANYVLEPSVLMGRFALFLADVVLAMLAGSGILAQYLLPSFPWLDDTVFSLLTSARLALWIWLSQGFLLSYQVPRWYVPACWVAYMIAGVCALLSVLQAPTAIPFLLVLGMIVISFAQIIAIVRTPGVDKSLRWLLLTGFVAIDLVIGVMIAATMLPTGIEQLPIYMARVSDLMPTAMLLGMIVLRNRQIRAELESTRGELLALNLRNEFDQKLHEERRMMLDMLTHELKNPLASISFAAGSLAQGNDPTPDKSRRLRNIQQSIETMDAVIERCSLVNSLGQSAIKIAPVPIDLSMLLSTVVEALPTPQRVLLNAPATLTIESDPSLLRMVFTNLLDNALKYAVGDSVVSVTLQKRPDEVLISFRNVVDPSLMPDAESVFSRFYRHPNAHHISGTGLGLFLVRELCQRLGGSARFRPTKDMVTFEVELPL